MDKLKTIYTALKATKIPATYRAWPEGKAPKLPFLCYLQDSSDNFAADNTVYFAVDNFTVELYTRNKDAAKESVVEDALSAFCVWEKSESYIDTERCYLISYTFQL